MHRIARSSQPIFSIRIPDWILHRETGLGDIIASGTKRAGINPCMRCKKRSDRLNRIVLFSPKKAAR